MRLINTETLNLEDFTLREKPIYAILSHTWAEDELTYQDMLRAIRTSRKGWDKVKRASRKALRHGYDYIWIDTCCIDKTSSAELGEAINSMFRWYMNAAVCYVYLADLEGEDEESLFECRWWTRGWTLQELIAPKKVNFYNAEWIYVSTKIHLCDAIEKRAGIPGDVLKDAAKGLWMDTATKMSWAANRNTTRLEDKAYCLLGLFDINMPLIYGEGERAFYRLQEEILKGRPDLSILAFNPIPDNRSHDYDLLAKSPQQFERILPNSQIAGGFDVSIINKQLKLKGAVPLVVYATTIEGEHHYRYALICRGWFPRGLLFVPLFKIGPYDFIREVGKPSVGHSAGIRKSTLGEDLNLSRIGHGAEISISLGLPLLRGLSKPINIGTNFKTRILWPHKTLHCVRAQPEVLFNISLESYILPASSVDSDTVATEFEFLSLTKGSSWGLSDLSGFIVLCQIGDPPNRTRIFHSDANKELCDFIFNKKRATEFLDNTKLDRRFGPFLKSLSHQLVVQDRSKNSWKIRVTGGYWQETFGHTRSQYELSMKHVNGSASSSNG